MTSQKHDRHAIPTHWTLRRQINRKRAFGQKEPFIGRIRKGEFSGQFEPTPAAVSVDRPGEKCCSRSPVARFGFDEGLASTVDR
jgi:hypothetical protein